VRGSYLPYLVFAWIPVFIVLCVVALNIAGLAFSPVLKQHTGRGRATVSRDILAFVAFWAACGLVGIVEMYDAFGWLMVLLGASQREIKEHFEMLSMPLDWANPTFIIRPDTNIVKVCGIIAFNSFFYAAALFATFKVVRIFLRRGNVTQLRISAKMPEDDDEI